MIDIESLKIVEDVSWEEAIDICRAYGRVENEINLDKVTVSETSTIPNQEWHQDGSHIEEFPKYAALWCEEAEENCPSTQYISTRIPVDFAEQLKDVTANLDFKKVMDENKFFKFKNKLEERFYRINAYHEKRNIVAQDSYGYYLKWCPFSVIDKDIHEMLCDYILSRPYYTVKWKSRQLAIYQNHATLHRRTPYENADGHRIIRRLYIH